MILAGVFLMILGAVNAFWPELPYSLFESWKHKDDSGEPSNLYLWRMRVSGGFALLLGALMILTEIF